MPHTVRLDRRHPSKHYAIVNKNTGKIVGRSKTKSQALASARIRDGASGHG